MTASHTDRRYQGCSSSICSRLCPSNVDKSKEPCPFLSSSSTSALLISKRNSDSLPLDTDILSTSSSSSPRTNDDKVTHVLATRLDHSLDYYTNKRIEQLHDRMDDIQITSFLNFINYHLSRTHPSKLVANLSEDLANGHVLLDLIEIFSSTKLKREHGRTRFHSLTNVQYVLDYLKSHMQHINISPHEIVAGNRKQILALLWIIMKIFDFPSFRLTTNKHLFNENTIFSFGQDRSVLLKWVNNLLNRILNTNQIYVRDFYIQTWLDCSYLSLIIKYLCPLSVNYGTATYFDYIKQFDQERFDFYINFSHYCFNTISPIDQCDRTEKSLFRFFSDLQQKIVYILKSNEIGKLSKSNPFTKQLLDSLNIESSEVVNDEQYLICTGEEQQQTESPKDEQTVDIVEEQPPDIVPMINEESLVNVNGIRARKAKKKRSTEKLSSISLSTTDEDFSVKIIEFLRQSKLLTLKYLLILACLCFSLLILFLHK